MVFLARAGGRAGWRAGGVWADGERVGKWLNPLDNQTRCGGYACEGPGQAGISGDTRRSPGVPVYCPGFETARVHPVPGHDRVYVPKFFKGRIGHFFCHFRIDLDFVDVQGPGGPGGPNRLWNV